MRVQIFVDVRELEMERRVTQPAPAIYAYRQILVDMANLRFEVRVRSALTQSR